MTGSVNRELIAWKERVIRERGELPRVFAVVTWGCAATTWLAKALNAHPDIFCTHYTRGQLRMLGTSIDEANDVDLLSVMRILASGHRLVGDVHGIHHKNVAALTSAFGDEFRAAGLIRNPLERLRSQIALFENGSSAPGASVDYSYVRNLSEFKAIAAEVTDEPDRMRFVEAARLLNTIIKELQLLPKIFRYEDITTDASAFATLVDYLSGNTLAVDRAFAESAVKNPRVNVHRRSATNLEFEPWQMRVLRAIVRPEAWSAYRDFGYGVSDFT